MNELNASNYSLFKSRYNRQESTERITLTNLSFETLPNAETADECINNDEVKAKYSKLERSVSLMNQPPNKPKEKYRRSHSYKSNESDRRVESGSQNIKSRGQVEVATQTRFSLNSQMIRDINELLIHHEISDSDENSADYEEEENKSDVWSYSPEEERVSEAEVSAEYEVTSDNPPSDNHIPDPPIHRCESSRNSLHRQQSESSELHDDDSNIQNVLPSLQSRRGAVHSAVNISDPKDKFKIPFLSKRKNDGKWSRSELNALMNESISDRLHPLDGLMTSHWSELMAERPNCDTVEYKHMDALWELFRAELVYLVDQLKIIKDVFQGTLKTAKDNGMLSDVDESLLFPNVNKLYKVSNAFSLDLYKMFTEGNATDDSVIYALQEFSTRFHQPYQRYCLNYTRAVKYLKSLKKRSDFKEYEKLCLEDERCKKRQLSDLLICPMQHLMRYVILLQDIQKHVPEDGREDLRETIHTIQESLRSLESKLATMQNFQRLQELDNILVWPTIDNVDKSVVIPDELRDMIAEDQATLASDGRHFQHAGPLYLIENPKSTESYCFLFDDMLLITKTNTSLRKRYSSKNDNQPSPAMLIDPFDTCGGLYDPEQRYIVYKQPISLDEIRVHDIASSPGGYKNCFSMLRYNRLNRCTGLYSFSASTPELKRVWMDKLSNYTSDDLKRNSQVIAPTHRRLRHDSAASVTPHNGDNISATSIPCSTPVEVTKSQNSEDNSERDSGVPLTPQTSIDVSNISIKLVDRSNSVEAQNTSSLSRSGNHLVKKGSGSFKSNYFFQKIPKRCRSSAS